MLLFFFDLYLFNLTPANSAHTFSASTKLIFSIFIINEKISPPEVPAQEPQ